LKKLVGLVTAVSLLFVGTSATYAHPGRTDANGGHTCRTNCEKWGLDYGEYHYHNGGYEPSYTDSYDETYVIDTYDPYEEAEKLVRKAESYAGSLKWEISIDYRKKKYPKNPVSQIDMKLYNNTKNALFEAHEAAQSLYDYSLIERVEAVEVIYLRAQAYIDAINAGQKLFSKFEEYRKLYKQNPNSAKTKQVYNELMNQAKKTNTMIYRVYGKSTREAMLQKYNVHKWLRTLK
jgi:predicted DNA-binding protein YlxM (UPF0122 family)